MAESSSAGFPYHRIVTELRAAILDGKLPQVIGSGAGRPGAPDDV
jgi:hypothetical protein